MANKEIESDLSELRNLLNQAQRPNVKTVLSKEISRLEALIKNVSIENGAPPPDKCVPAPSVAPPLPLVKLITYAWDQSDKFLKIYVTLPKAETAEPEQVTVDFQEKSVVMHCNNVAGKNYDFNVTDFLFPTVPEKSYFKLKTDTVLLMLKKQTESQNWEFITFHEFYAKEKRMAKATKASKDGGDPLMSIMKNMYEDGDDEMKRNIKKAMFESQQKKQTGQPQSPTSALGPVGDMMNTVQQLGAMKKGMNQ